jgi:hypothetical protein
MIGGIGIYSGIQPRTEYNLYFLRPSAEGITQGYIRAKITYKLPKVTSRRLKVREVATLLRRRCCNIAN